jgi:REP element-mobilizing transposase RayT
MLFLVLYFQSPVLFPKIGRIVSSFSEDTGFDVHDEAFEHVVQSRCVELVAFCLMHNHFHLLVRELVEGGIAVYMQRVLTAYTKYFHARHDASGHVFQGRYQAKHIADNEYLMHLSAYIHRNPRELRAWKGREADYPWSSYQDYVKENRWGGLLAQEIILDQFEGTKRSNYADYIKSSPAKELDSEF